ncbi:MAG: YncE family protein [Cognatishimia sp.]
MLNRRQMLGGIAAISATPAYAGLFSRKPDLRDAERYAFVPSFIEPRIAAIDLVKAKHVATLELPHVPGDIIVSKMLGMLFATNPAAGQLTPVMLSTQEIGPSFDVGVQPDHALLGIEDQFAAFWSDDGALVVWDLKNIRPIYRNLGFQPGAQVSFSANGRGLYVVEGAHNQLIHVNLEEARISDIVPLGLDVPSVSISAVTRSVDGMTGIISVTDQDRLLVVDLPAMKLARTLHQSGGPGRVLSTADGRFTLVPNRLGKSVTVLNANGFTPIRTIAVDIVPAEINTGWFDTMLYVMSDETNAIEVISLEDMQRTGSIPLPAPGDAGVVSADMRSLAVSIGASGQVLIADATAGSTRAVVDTNVKGIKGIQLGVSNNICH